ncbi:MAG: hypothetical protein AAB116_15925 [Candidatus Poribacteria bacterium]
MKKFINVFILLLIGFLLSGISATAEDKITLLKSQISSLEAQRSRLEGEKQVFVNQVDKLSYKIEGLKSQSDSGIGVIGKYKLSQNLRKAQSLSEKIQLLDRNTSDLNNQIKDKQSQLEKEYENQINTLIQRLNGISNVDEKKIILSKIKEYQFARDQLKNSNKQSLERIDTAGIEIKGYDSPEDIREKADLINDLANKTNTKISMLDSRIVSLKNEIKTRKKMSEFADEISFFGERVARDEVASKIATTDNSKKKETTDKGADTNNEVLDANTKTLIVDPKTTDRTQNPTTDTTPLTASPTKKVMKSNGVSAGITQIPQNSVERELMALEKQRQELKKESTILSEKANSFRKKADELGKSGSKTGETQNTKAKKQSSNAKTRNEDRSQKKR